MARVPKVVRGKISFSPGIRRCPNYFSFLWSDRRLYIVRNIYRIYIYMCVCVCVCIYIYIYIERERERERDISDCVETVYELPLLPNNVTVKHFYTERALRSVDWIIMGALAWRWLDEYVTLDRTFYSLLFKQGVAIAPVTAKFSSLSHSCRRPLWEIYEKYNSKTFIRNVL